MNRHYKIVMWWKTKNSETEITLHNRTIAEALVIARAHGYKKPVWWKPWQYVTGGLGMYTVSEYGSCEGRNG